MNLDEQDAQTIGTGNHQAFQFVKDSTTGQNQNVVEETRC